MKRPDPQSPAPQPIADCGGVMTNVQSERDPYERLDDLMVVVEALCPVWPQRSVPAGLGKWLL
jgi:hypothetical protein